MPDEVDSAFLRTAVDVGALDPSIADEVRAAVAQVLELGGASSAEEIVRNRKLLTEFQIEKVREACSAPLPSPASTPEMIGAFELLAPMTESDRSVVYRARQPAMGREVALKALKPGADAAAVKQFMAEGRALSSVIHANVVQGFEVGEADGRAYFAMELIDGETLRERLRRAGRLSEQEALDLARQVGLALAEAEKAGLVHGNVKPANVLLTRKGTVKLAALGMAKCMPIVGTPLYMSPEQARGEAADARSDIYALGATLYHAVVGEPPFQGSAAKEVMLHHVTAPVPSARQAVPELSEEFSCLVASMLAKAPEQRPASAAKLIEAVDRVRQGKRVAAPRAAALAAAGRPSVQPRATRPNGEDRRRRERPPQQQSSSATVIYIVVGAVAVLAIAVLILLGEGKDEPTRKKAPKVVHRKKRDVTAEEAEKEIAKIQRYIEGGTRDPERLVRLYKGVVSRFPGTPGAAKARKEVVRIEREVAAKVQRELDAIAVKAKALAAQNKFPEAVELLRQFSAEHPKAYSEASNVEGMILSEANRQEKTRSEKARRLAQQGDYDGAIALYREIITFNIPQLTGKAKYEISVLEKKRDAARENARKGAAATWESQQLRRFAMLSQRQYVVARKTFELLLADPKMESIREKIEAELAHVDVIESVWAAADKAGKAIPADEVLAVGGIRGTFVSYTDGQLSIRSSGVEVTKSLRELPATEIVALADRALPADAPAAQFARGAFLLAEGKSDLAAKAFAAGQAAGGEAKAHWARLDHWKANRLEVEAEAAFSELGALADEQKWKPLREAMAAYNSKFGKTRSADVRRDAVAAFVLEARLATLSVADLFAGVCRPVANGRKVEVLYDFSSPEQLADWAIRGAAWGVKDGMLTLKGARAVLAAPAMQDAAITIETGNGGGAGSWGVAFESDKATALCYATHLPEQAGMPASITDGKAEVGQGATRFTNGQMRKVAFGLRGKRLGLNVDGRTIVSGTVHSRPTTRMHAVIRAAPTRLMRVGSARVSLTLSDAWVAEELAAMRSLLGKQAALAACEWGQAMGRSVLEPWTAVAGNWSVEQGVASVPQAAALVLGEAKKPKICSDLEWCVSVQPAHETSVVCFWLRSGPQGAGYALRLGGAGKCVLAATGEKLPSGGDVLARFDAGVDWQAKQWYDLRILAVGRQIRVELGGAVLCVVRDGRWSAGSLAMDVVQSGAAFRDVRLRFLN